MDYDIYRSRAMNVLLYLRAISLQRRAASELKLLATRTKAAFTAWYPINFEGVGGDL